MGMKGITLKGKGRGRHCDTQGFTLAIAYVIDEGADVNSQGGEYGNALQAASYKGDEDIIQLYIEPPTCRGTAEIFLFSFGLNLEWNVSPTCNHTAYHQHTDIM